MANTFKSVFKEDCLNTGTGTDVLTCPSSNSSKCVLIGVHLSNKTGSEVTATINLIDNSENSSNEITLVNAVRIPANSMLAVLEGEKLILEEQDVLRVVGSAATSVNAFVSYLLSDST